MKTLLAILMLAAAPSLAQAETFTFKTSNKPIDQVQLPASGGPGSRPTGASVFIANTVTTYADGKTVNTSGKCSSWILPSGNAFGSNGVCTYSEAGATAYTVTYTCEVPVANESNCWGKLYGVGGEYKGRNGLISFHAGPNGQGAGLWN